MPAPLLYISSAPADEPLCLELVRHLAALERRGALRVARASRDEPLAAADVVVLLVSADYLDSVTLHDLELTPALARARAGTAQVIAVLARACDVDRALFEGLRILPANGPAVTSWPNRDEAWAGIVKEIRALVLGSGPAPAPGETAPFHVPFPRNERFFGREADLERLHAILREHRTASVRPAMLTGMGGIGKTQLAVAYAHDHRADYPGGIYWINAGGADWRSAIADLAAEMRLEVEGEGERQTRLVAAFAEHVGARPDALVVFDNVEDPADLATKQRAGFVPENLGCRVLFTTRRRDSAGRFGSIEVTALPEEAALDLLLSGEKRKALREKVHAGMVAADREAALAVCRALGRLPLALVMAAAYLDLHDEIPVADYLVRLREEGGLSTVDEAEDALDAEAQRRATLATRHDAAVAATLAMQWAAIKTADARAVLRTAALLEEAAAIPRARIALLTGLGEKAAKGRPAPLKRALEELYRLSLVEALTAEEVRLHPLVREFAGRQIEAREAFAAGCAERLGEALWEMGRLHEEVAGRGIDAVLGDLRVGMRLAGGEGRARIERLARPLDREAHCLRRWDVEGEPGFLLQQVHNQCVEMGIAQVRERAEKELAERRWSWVRERFPVGGESEALVRTLEGHTDSVTGVAVTPDGRFAVSASKDKTLKVWDLATGQGVYTLEGHAGEVTGVAVTSDGRFAVSASKDKTLKVWDLRKGQTVRTLEGHTDDVTGVAVTPDGRFAVSASDDRTLKVWDLATGQAVRTLEGHPEWVTGVAVTPDGRFAVSAFGDMTIRVWDLATGRAVRILQGHVEELTGVAVTSDGRSAVVSSGAELTVFDLATGQAVRTLRGHDDYVFGLAVTPNDRVVSASRDKTLRVWDLATGRAVRTLRGHASFVRGVAVTSDGRYVVSASSDDTLKVWDLASGHAARTVHRHTEAVTGVAVAPDGRFAVSAAWDNALKMWDLAAGLAERTLQGHSSIVSDVVVTSDGRFALSASVDKALRAWDLATGRVSRVLRGHTGYVTGVAVTSDGRFAVSASYDTTLKVWDLATWQVVRTLEGHIKEVNSVAVTSDDRCAVSASNDTTLVVWDLATGRAVRTLEGHTDSVNGVAVAPDGRFCVSASQDKTLKVWDLATGQAIRTLEGHTHWLNGVAVAPDGRFAVSASWDKTLKVWDLATGRPLATLETHAPLTCCAITPDARTILAGDDLGALHILDWLPHPDPSAA